jgi:hypothetical protein
MPQLVKDGEKPALLQQAEAVEPVPGADNAPAAAAPTDEITEPPVEPTNDAELDAALEAAQAEASEETDTAPTEAEDVSSEEAPKKGRRNRR